MNEHRDKLAGSDLQPLEAALAEAKKVLENAEAGADEMKGVAERLTKASHKLAEIMYQQTAHQHAAGTDGGVKPGPDAGGKPPEDVIDAEYEDAK